MFMFLEEDGVYVRSFGRVKRQWMAKQEMDYFLDANRTEVGWGT